MNCSSNSITSVPEFKDFGAGVDGPPAKIKCTTTTYNYAATFEAEKEAEELVASEKVWSVRKKVHTESGYKTYFRCNRVKVRGEQCSASIYLLYESASLRVVLFRSEAEHNCSSISTKAETTKMTQEVKQLIEELCQQNKKPLAIIDALTVLKLPVPKPYQISNHIAAFKKRKFGPTTISLSELLSITDKFAAVPDSDETPFMITELQHDTLNFRVFATSKALIRKAEYAKCLCADATYKLMWQGFPVLVVGTTDMNRKFHLIGLAVCRNEQEDDFKFLFESVKVSAHKLIGVRVAPTVLVSDAAPAIGNAFKNAFGEQVIIVMCWAHAFKNLQKKINLVDNKSDQKLILADIAFIQTIATIQEFELARTLFVEKWASKTEFIAYFTREWVEKNANWFEGVVQHIPSTNNALEATNRVLKDDITKRERVALSVFISLMVDLIGRYSRRCNTDQVFATTTTISKNTWVAAHQWAKTAGKLKVHSTHDGNKTISVKSSSFDDEPHIVRSDWKSLSEFKSFYTSTWTVTRIKPETNWLKAICSCPIYQKQFICKHVVGIAVLIGHVALPADAKNQIIESKRKRGRPTKAKTAYVVQ